MLLNFNSTTVQYCIYYNTLYQFILQDHNLYVKLGMINP